MFSERLKILRKESGWTQDKVAELIEIPKPTYAGYENGIRQPKFETVVKLAELYNTSADYLLGITHDKTPKEPSNDIKKLLKERNYNLDGIPLNEKDMDRFLNYLDQYKEIITELKKETNTNKKEDCIKNNSN
jgi:transcriptional regulator with XRE-family HTH domain